MDTIDDILKHIDLEELREVKDRMKKNKELWTYSKHIGTFYGGDMFIKIVFDPRRWSNEGDNNKS